MKTVDSKKTNHQPKSAPAYLLARAAEAEKQAETARKLARAAKARFKDARKAYKQAKKFAKQARKEAKAAGKAGKKAPKRTSKGLKKKAAPAPTALKSIHRIPAGQPRPVRKPKSAIPASAPVRPSAPSVTNAGSDIAQA